MITWLKPGGVKQSPALVTNRIFVSSFVPRQTKEKKEIERGKTRITKAKFPTKIQPIMSYWFMMIMHIIFDLMGNDLQSQSTTCPWFGIKMKHLPMWDFIHLEWFSSIWLDPVFLLMLFYKWNANILNLILVMRNSICMLSFSSSHNVFLQKYMLFWPVWRFVSLLSVFTF